MVLTLRGNHFPFWSTKEAKEKQWLIWTQVCVLDGLKPSSASVKLLENVFHTSGCIFQELPQGYLHSPTCPSWPLWNGLIILMTDNVNPWMFASATENLAGFAGPPTTKTVGSEAAESSRSEHCSAVLGNCTVGPDPRCLWGCHCQRSSLPHTKKCKRGTGFCGNSGVLVNFYTPLSTMSLPIISPS